MLNKTRATVVNAYKIFTKTHNIFENVIPEVFNIRDKIDWNIIELTKYFLMPKNHPKLLNIHKQLIVFQKKIHLVIK